MKKNFFRQIIISFFSLGLMTKNLQGEKKFRGFLPLLGVSVVLTLLAQFSFIGNSFGAPDSAAGQSSGSSFPGIKSAAAQSASGNSAENMINLSPGATGNIPGEGAALEKFTLPASSQNTPPAPKTEAGSGAAEKAGTALQNTATQTAAETAAMDEKQLILEALQQKLKSDISELKGLKANVEALKEKRSEADALRWQDLVNLYEFMDPRAAASIFNGLQPLVLYEVVSRMNPRKAALILAYMDPQKAQQVTEMLAHPDAMQAYIANLPSNNAFLSRF